MATKQNKTDTLSKEYIKGLSYETPYFLFSKDCLKHNIQEFETDFPMAEVFYAMKANFNPDILKELHDLGVGFEVASKFELQLLKTLQVAPEKIIYGTAVKPESHIKDFYDYGVRVFACDNIEELQKIARQAPAAKVYVRLHADNHGSSIDLSEKFGTTPDVALELLEACGELGLEPYGVSFHVGSQSADMTSWAKHIAHAHEVIKAAEEKGITLSIINIGGGYPCKYSSFQNHMALMDIASTVEEEIKRLQLQQRIITEPGRRLVANAGVAVTSVIGRSSKHGKNWLFLDMGVYSGLMQTAKFQEATRYYITSLDKEEEADDDLVAYCLAGPTGDGPDVIDREVLLPKDMAIGDRLVVHDIGAYSLPTVCNFHAFPAPCVYIV